jgi:hypothetical protein
LAGPPGDEPRSRQRQPRLASLPLARLAPCDLVRPRVSENDNAQLASGLFGLDPLSSEQAVPAGSIRRFESASSFGGLGEDGVAAVGKNR